VAGIPLGVDGNVNGVSDGWSASGNNGYDGTMVYSVVGGEQVITISDGTNTNEPFIESPAKVSIAGHIATETLIVRKTGDIKVKLRVIYRNSIFNELLVQDVISESETDTVLINTLTAPATTADIIIKIRIMPNASGSAGSIYVKNSLLTISNQSAYVTTLYDQSGNGNHAVQTTAASQPRIVNAGIVERDFDATKCTALYSTFASASGVNLVSNGDFSNGTTGWSGISCNISASNNICTVTGTAGTTFSPSQNTTTPIVVGRRYFVRAKIKAKTQDTQITTIGLRVVGSTGGVTTQVAAQANPVTGTQYEIYGVYVGAATHTGNVSISVRCTVSDTSIGKVMEVQEVVCIDVTDLGKPALYFDGTNDVMSIANSASVDILGAPLMLNCVMNNAGQAGYVIIKNLDSFATTQYGISYESTNLRNGLVLEGQVRQYTANSAIPINTQKIYSGIFENGVQQGFVNGANSGADGNYNSTLTSRANMQIGARSNNVGGTSFLTFFKGYIPEIVIVKSISPRQKIETNQKKYYGITV
jgi:hypothetical protein